MRRGLVKICAVFAVLLPALAQAQFIFHTNNGVLTIWGYIGTGRAIVIPDATNGYPVTSINNGALQNHPSFTSVVIPNSITNIGENAFLSCYALTNFIIGSGVTNIGSGPFANCHTLKAITVNPTNAFFCSSNGVLFNKNLSTLIQFPGGLGGSYTIPGTVTHVGFEAFDGCTLLSSVAIGAGVTNISDWAFLYCIQLAAINVDSSNDVYSSTNGVLFDKTKTTIITYPPAVGGSYSVPDGVTHIRDYAFSYCFGLTQVTMPASLTILDWNSFFSDGSLTAIYFPRNAPDTEGFNPFGFASPVVYYLPGTTGWDVFATNTGAPQILWLPQVQTTDASFGVQNNQFGFNINWASGQTVVVEACTNLTNPIWTPIATNTLTGSSSYFSDPQWTNYPGRFYRLRSP